jgi:PAS domain S-box-containing protein
VVGITLDISDRYALSDELAREREDSRKTALVAERTDNGVVITDPQGRVEWVNAGFERLSGYSMAELAGRRPGDLLQGPASDPATVRALRAAIAAVRPITIELVNYRRDGSPYWVEIDLQPVVDADGKASRYIAIQRNVTERKREAGLHAVRELALSHTHDGDDLRSTLPDVTAALETSFIDARVAVLVTAPDGQTLQCLAAPNLPADTVTLLDGVAVGGAGGALGRAAEGARIAVARVADDPVLAPLAASGSQEGYRDCWVEPLSALDGTRVGVLLVLFRRPAATDSAKGAFVQRVADAFANLIDRERRETAMRRSERHFRALAEVLPVLVSYVDRELRFGYTNASHDAFLGVPPGSLVGQPMHKVFHESSWAEVAAQLPRVLAGQRVSTEAVRQYWDGRERQVQATYVPDVDTDGTVAGFYCIIEDISEFRRREAELHRAKEQAQASSAAKSAFLANMSHELRTPLNAVIGYSEMMQAEMLGPIGNDKYKSYIDDIHASGKYLLELIEDVLDLSKLDAGARQLAQDQVPLAPAVQQALVVLGMVDDPSVTLGVADGLSVHGDARALKQVLVNLIGNAAKYAKGAAIRVAAWRDGGACMIEVSDTGPGIPAHEVPRITEPFYTVDQRSWVASETGGGTGIGLALVKRLVEEMGGRMVIESAVGQGTTVMLRMRTLV